MFGHKSQMISPSDALEGRPAAIPTADTHFVNGNPIHPPFPDGIETAVFGMGCFWGAEKLFWETPGVYSTAAGYAGGFTPNPTYEEVCSALTGHTEVVLVAFDPTQISFDAVLRLFWENHDPTQGMRQGADRGTQYRSAIYTQSDDQADAAKRSRDMFQAELKKSGFGEITTEIQPLGDFYYAEGYHQQYLEKNPNGYCPDHSCGVRFPGSP